MEFTRYVKMWIFFKVIHFDQILIVEGYNFNYFPLIKEKAIYL